MTTRGVAIACLAALGAWLALDELTFWTLGFLQDTPLFSSWAYLTVGALTAALIGGRGLRRAGIERAGWLLLAAAVVAWTLGDVAFELAIPHDPVPYPSIADAGYLAFNPLAGAGLLLLLRAHLPRPSLAQAFDGLVGALGAAAVMGAVTLTVLSAEDGGSRAARITNLAYPALDALLVGTVACAWALCGWRLTRMWMLLGAGVALFAAADSAYLVQVALGVDGEGSPLDPAWSASFVVLACAAVLARAEVPRAATADDARHITATVLMSAAVLGLLVVGAFLRLHPGAVVLATAAAAAMVARLTLTLRTNARLVHAARTEAITDALTSLGNRRALVGELDAALASSRPVTLMLCDLDGFKGFNDAFGHPAGDELLVRVAGRLRLAVGDGARAFRLGGDEFCVLFAGHVAGSELARTAAALAECGDGYSVGVSFGAAWLPDEAGDGPAALRLVDGRMYEQKHDRRASARRGSAGTPPPGVAAVAVPDGGTV